MLKSTREAAGGCGSGGGGCPIKNRGGGGGGGIGDPAEGAVNPANAMPLAPNQQAAPGQRVPLPTDRVTSTIPSGQGHDPLWVYPSQQMFYNAMRRKGYAPREQEMDAVVAIHNSVNERAWSQVLAWERVLHPQCAAGLQLLRFEGKPDQPTPKARLRSLAGYMPPFDRHDWVVSRCGEEVTYLIDFYNGKPTPAKPVSMHIDARPAADDIQGAWDRLRMPFVRLWSSMGAPAPTAAAGTTSGSQAARAE